MAWQVTALLLPLVLLLADPATSKSNSFRMSPEKQTARLGDKVTLKCEVTQDTQGCSWLLQTRVLTSSPRFLLYINQVNMQRLGPGVKSEKIKGEKVSSDRHSSTYSLTLYNFDEDSEGYYFCAILVNSIILFSPYVPVFTPAKPTTTPAPRPPTPAPTKALPPATTRPEVCLPTTTRRAAETKGLNFSCDLYIWAPLAGTSGLLLLSLVIMLIYNHKNRRRVCKCPRPQVRQGVKPSPSERYV